MGKQKRGAVEKNGTVAVFLNQAAELAVGVAEERIGVNEYVESIDGLRAELPEENLAEVEVAIQLAAFKMDQEGIKTSDEIRQCYRIAAEVPRKAIDDVRKAPLN